MKMVCKYRGDKVMLLFYECLNEEIKSDDNLKICEFVIYNVECPEGVVYR